MQTMVKRSWILDQVNFQISLDQQHSCWNPNSSRIHPFDIVSNSWMVVRMEMHRCYWIKCLIIDNSLCLWKSFGYRFNFVFIDTSIKCMSLCLLHILWSLDRPFMVYCKVPGNINWNNWINCINGYLPLDCWRGRI